MLNFMLHSEDSLSSKSLFAESEVTHEEKDPTQYIQSSTGRMQGSEVSEGQVVKGFALGLGVPCTCGGIKARLLCFQVPPPYV